MGRANRETAADGVVVREEQPQDLERVGQLNRDVFPTAAEADLVDALRSRCRPFISFVAADGDDVVGHIAFSAMTLEPAVNGVVLGLGPMCVRAERQRQGIGGRLVTAGLTRCRALGAIAVFVLGHADYYPRFGFVPASGLSITSEYEVPDEAFMILEFESEQVGEGARLARYHQAFASTV